MVSRFCVVESFFIPFYFYSFIKHNLEIMVKLKTYKYPSYLKELAKHKLEDSEHLSPSVRQQLPRVRQAWTLLEQRNCVENTALSLSECALVLSVCSQASAGHCALHEELHWALSPPSIPGRDSDGGGHQEVWSLWQDHDPRQRKQKVAHSQSEWEAKWSPNVFLFMSDVTTDIMMSITIFFMIALSL